MKPAEKAFGERLSLPSRAQLCASLSRMFSRLGDTQYATIDRIEHNGLDWLYLQPTAFTLFSPIEKYLKDLGIHTDGTIGSIMRSPLRLSHEDVHVLTCSCHSVASAKRAAHLFRRMARKERVREMLSRAIRSLRFW